MGTGILTIYRRICCKILTFLYFYVNIVVGGVFMKKISITILLTIMIFFCAMPVYASNDITTNEKIISLWKSSDLPLISPYSK